MPDYTMPSTCTHPSRRLRLPRTLRGDWPTGWLGVKPDEMEWCPECDQPENGAACG